MHFWSIFGSHQLVRVHRYGGEQTSYVYSIGRSRPDRMFKTRKPSRNLCREAPNSYVCLSQIYQI
ncbi:hypothetical protein C7T94_12555 [Pedobacter yulinensis]|uniref:Uncharacterized protein n=1 Tax=Pedobacter yulinensis TaxID=2126353 RepID=A0A2T3HLQ8_9SPHI|nr:hypothetical protein C7T94_12555 [Pedobacter yulinensis]